MHRSSEPLIVGAGPVGLAAALFLTRQGCTPRVIEMRQEASKQSRALAVNPRTLDILRPTGVTQRMLDIGLPVRGGRFYRRTRNVATVSFDGIHPHYPFLLALSQAATERLLAESLERAGGKVQRGRKLVECRTSGEEVEAVIEPTEGGSREVVRCPWLLAADGAHSVARQQLAIDFPGSAFKEPWYLADVPLRTALAPDHAHVFFLAGGELLFLVRVVDDALQDRDGEPIWRVIAKHPQPLAQLVEAEQAGPPLWESNFHISHRIDAAMAAGRVFFAGDAAHIHSPVARGA